MNTRTQQPYLIEAHLTTEPAELIATVNTFSEKDLNMYFEELYKSYYEKIHRYFSFRLKDKSEADDLTQTVFLKVCGALKKHMWNGAGGIYYIFIIARNTLIDYFRKNKHMTIVSDEIIQSVADTVTTTSPIEDREEREFLMAAMQDLKQSESQAVQLRYFDDLEYRSIAEIMGKREVTVRQLVHRGLKSIRIVLVKS